MRLLAAAALIVACSAPGALPSISIPSLAPGTLAFDPGEPAMAEKVGALARAFPSGIGVWVADPDRRDPLFALRADDEVIAASLFKLAVLLHAESLIEQKKLKPDDEIDGTPWTVEDALELMIVESENESALALIETFGAPAINATVSRYKIDGLRLAEDLDSENTATPRGVGTFFSELAKRKLVSAAASERMIARLQRASNRDRLPAMLPAGARVAHKIGTLVGLVHDAGILFTPRGPRVVVVLTTDADEDTANVAIAKIGRAVWDGR